MKHLQREPSPPWGAGTSPAPGIGSRQPAAWPRADNATMAKLRDIVIDCPHPASLARFWAAALDGYAVAPYDDAEIDRLRSLGIYDLEDDPSVMVEGPGPRLCLQRVPEARTVKNRVHLDLTADHPQEEIGRLVSIGASVVGRYESHVTLADPQGNEFCVMMD